MLVAMRRIALVLLAACGPPPSAPSPCRGVERDREARAPALGDGDVRRVAEIAFLSLASGTDGPT